MSSLNDSETLCSMIKIMVATDCCVRDGLSGMRGAFGECRIIRR